MTSAAVGLGRGRLLGVLVVAIAAAVVWLIVGLPSGKATSGGSSYTVPVVQDTDPRPKVVETTLRAENATVDIGNGVQAHAQTFNGSIPGPTFGLNVGDTVIVHFENHLSSPTGIHWHGIEDSNETDGTPYVQNQVPAGGTHLYKFTVTRPGLFWYHPHHHSSTNQVFRGLYGMIIVRDPNGAQLQANGTLPSAADTHPVVLSDTTVCKQPPNNDTATYDPSLPHVSGGALPAQPAPTPKDLCETSPLDENGAPRGPFAAGDIPNIQTGATFGRVNEGQTVLTNGKNVGARAGSPGAPGALAPGAQTLPVKAGQGVRLQMLNASAVRYMRLRLTSSSGIVQTLFRVGGEGGILDEAVREGGTTPGGFDTKYSQGEILLPPGTRADVVFAVPSNATGVMTMWTEDYSRTGAGFSNIPTVPVMHFQVNGSVAPAYSIAPGTDLRIATGNTVETLGAPTDVLLNPATFTPQKKGSVLQQTTFTSQANNKLGVDNVFGEHDVQGDYRNIDHLDSSRYAKSGDLLELSVKNVTGAHHPFHLHGFSIQPKSLTKAGDPTFTWPYREFRDNVDIPPGYTLTYRLRIDPRPQPDGVTPGGELGRWLFHCHIFFHATDGMLSELVITSANGNERPDIDVDGANATVEQDNEVTKTGTFKDRDGDPVTLSASRGTVTNDGGGHWTWKFTPTASSGTGRVFITATDSGGRIGQTAFQLNVTNTKPKLRVPGGFTTARGARLAFGVTATDSNPSDTLTLSARSLPRRLGFKDRGGGKGRVSGKVTAAVGSYVARIRANDAKHATPVTRRVKMKVLRKGLKGLVRRRARLRRRSIGAGCRLAFISLKSCRVTVLRKGKRVGRATRKLKSRGKKAARLRVRLRRSFRGLVAGSRRGVPVTVRFQAQTFGVRQTLTVKRRVRVVR